MRAQPNPDQNAKQDEHFLLYPLHSVVGVFEDEKEAEPAIDELHEFGYPDKDIEIFSGADGAKRLDPAGTFHGRISKVLRSLQSIGPDRTYIERQEKYLQDGHCIVMVHVANKRRKGTATDILKRHTSKPVTYFGMLTMEDAQ